MKLAYFDIHTHITPGVDDGAKNEEIMLAMLKKSFDGGIRNIILTPHYNERTEMTEEAGASMDFAIKRALAISPELKLYKGNEVYFSSSVIEKLNAGELNTLAGSRYVLVEFSPAIKFTNLRNNINELIMNAYRPIIAHVERYECLYKEFVYDLVEMGAFLQVNANSILRGSLKTKRFCKRLLREELVTFIASDCHNLSERPPNLSECIEHITKKYSKDYAYKLFYLNASKIILHEEIYN